MPIAEAGVTFERFLVSGEYQIRRVCWGFAMERRAEHKILVIEGDPLTRYIEKNLREEGYHHVCTVSPDVSFHDLEILGPDLAIISPSASREQCCHSIRKLKIRNLHMPVFIMSDKSAETENPYSNFPMVGILKGGNGNGDGNRISQQIEKALGEKSEGSLPDLPVFVGCSPQACAIRDRIFKVAEKDVPVLITGETGTGKEVIARSIHYFSRRRNGPLVNISCGNLPDQLVESEIFGFQKGAFTDAYRNKPGRLELANNGTLFLDEIGELSLHLQVKFLQIFEDRAFSRLGAMDERMIDVRVVAATNSDLRKKVRDGAFREDLFYRLNVVHIRTTAIREKKEDILPLMRHFLNKYSSALGREPPDLPQPIQEKLTEYPWPGNVRELENVARRAIVLRNWDFVRHELHPGKARPPENHSPPPEWLVNPAAEYFKSGKCSLKEITAAHVSGVERKAILEALRSVHWNRRKAAVQLGVSYKTVCNRVKELNLRPT
jgi:DNA-binding NtrC family response regulator